MSLLDYLVMVFFWLAAFGWALYFNAARYAKLHAQEKAMRDRMQAHISERLR